MNLNLTCQKTHILAWINADQTLSLKLNGVKYLAYPKLDKRGEKYWKVDGLHSTPPISQETLKAEIEEILKKPMSHQTVEDRKKWEQWVKLQAKPNQEEKSEPINPS